MTTPSPVSPTDLEDAQIASLLEGQLAALRAFVRLRMGPAIAARESSGDVVQSVCRELLQGMERYAFNNEAALRAWLYTAAIRKIMQKARYHKSSMRDVARERHDDLALLERYSSCVTPSRDASAREEVERFEGAIARLSAPHREIIGLVKVAGLSHAAAGEIMGRSEASSRTLLRRALIELAAILEPGDTE